MQSNATTGDAPPPQRRFVGDDLDAGSVEHLRSSFARLHGRPLDEPTAVARFLEDQSELLAAIGAEGARRYIAMTCNTNDAAVRERYLAFEREVSPLSKREADRLDRKLLATSARNRLDAGRYRVLLRKKTNLVDLFREENSALEVTESELQARYAEITGAMTVRFAGEEHTLQKLAMRLEEPDRAVREAAWRTIADRRRQDRGEITELFDRLLELRQRIAANAGCRDYVVFKFREYCRFDYGPEHCQEFHAAVEQTVLPAIARLDAERRQRLGLMTLRPWDFDVDPTGAAPVRPFTTQDELIHLARTLFAAVDPRFASEFGILERNRLLDLMSRPGKAPGGYQYSLEDVRLPFIFANAVGKHDDVQTLLHEGGHAFHSLLSRDEPLLDYREAPLEFAEVASMGMELMALEHLPAIYEAATARRVYRAHLQGILRILPWIASIDAFQHWLYGNPGHDHAQRQRAWLEIRRRFAPGVDYSGLEDYLGHDWQRQGHLFGAPLYYIEYGIAQIGALQVWRAARQDRGAAVEDYRAALSLGGSRPLPELFAAAGLRFEMGPAILRELVAEIEAALAES